MENMDRYFYMIVQGDNEEKIIHLQGNIYYNDENMCYEHAEWTFMLLKISKAKRMMNEKAFYNYVDDRINYFEDITEEVATARIENYFDEEPGTELDILNITEDTPCGCYWFERR